jgi:hypothetical protein
VAQLQSTFWREGVVAKAVTLPDLTVPPMDKQLAALVLCNATSVLDCFTLSVVDSRNTAIACTSDSPITVVRHDMLIFA